MKFDSTHPHLAFVEPLPSADADVPAPIQMGAACCRSGDAWGALNHWVPLADRGIPEAMFLAGTLLAKGGRGVPVDLERAYRYLHAAAVAGDSRAAFNAGLLGLRGRAPSDASTFLDLPTCAAWLRLAGQLSEDSRIHERVHRIAGAITRELSDADVAAVPAIMERVIRIPFEVLRGQKA